MCPPLHHGTIGAAGRYNIGVIGQKSNVLYEGRVRCKGSVWRLIDHNWIVEQTHEAIVASDCAEIFVVAAADSIDIRAIHAVLPHAHDLKAQNACPRGELFIARVLQHLLDTWRRAVSQTQRVFMPR